MLANNTEKTRFNMVEQQIRPCEVTDQNVLDIIQVVPRENFVPEEFSGLAFADLEIPIGHGQNMMFPRIEARMLQALDIKNTDHVLEIGTGSGFITACLAKLAASVISFDIHTDFIEAACERLYALDINNAELQTANIFTDDLPLTNFDVIAVTGSVPSDDGKLRELLADGGRMFMITGLAPAMEATLVTRVGDDFYRTEGMFETVLKALEGAPEAPEFQF